LALYVPNDEAAQIAADLIPKFHTRLTGAKISHLLNVKNPPKKAATKQPRQGKKVTIAKCSKVSAKTQALVGDDIHFVIEYNSLIWDAMDFRQKTAVVDHELGHAGNDADGFYMVNHDIEDFGYMIDRYGFWKKDLEAFGKVVIDNFLKGNVEVPSDNTEVSVEQSGD